MESSALPVAPSPAAVEKNTPDLLIPKGISNTPPELPPVNDLNGVFQEHGHCFVITKPRATPRPWINCCYNDSFYLNCDSFGRSMVQVRNQEGRWAIMNLKRDQFGYTGDKGIYIRDDATGHFWDAGWSYTQRAFDKHEVEMRPGSVTIKHEYDGIEATWRIFVPTDDAAECWWLTLRNLRDNPRQLSLYPFQIADLSGYSAPEGSAAGRADSYWRASIDSQWHAVTCRSEAPFVQFDRYGLMLASDLKPSSYESSSAEFMGPATNLTFPQGLQREHLSNREAFGEEMLAALQLTMELKPGETREVQILAAPVGHDRVYQQALVQRYLAKGAMKAAWQAVTEKTSQRQARLQILTPDAATQLLANYWIPHQVGLCARYSRGWGLGYRDSLQDAVALGIMEPAEHSNATTPHMQYILEGCLAAQHADGTTPRKWSPLSHENYSDGPCWLIESIVRHVHVTGDASFLDREFPFLDGPAAPVHEHATRAVNALFADRGQHGLVKIRGGDWNDGITGAGRRGEGESVLNSLMLLRNLHQLQSLRQALGKNDPWQPQDAAWKQAGAELLAAIRKHGWDGAYFRRAYDDAGQPLGASGAATGEIFLEPQAFGLLADALSPEDVAPLIQSVREKLETDYGCRLLAPSYRKYDPAIGRLTGHIPGMWENGAVYCHATAFYIHGLCRHGHTDLAFHLFKSLTGMNPKNPSSSSGLEPYVLTNCFSGPEHEGKPGVSRFSWFTGTAGWILRYLYEVMPGIEPELNGLRLRRPGMPSTWKSMSLTRVIRKRTYHVIIKPGKSALPRVTWNDQQLETDWLPDSQASANNTVTVDWS